MQLSRARVRVSPAFITAANDTLLPGVPQDERAASRLWLIAAMKGNADAIYSVGMGFLNGKVAFLWFGWHHVSPSCVHRRGRH